MVIEHDNIIYIRDFTEIGGVETFTYEMAKKYKNLDIAVVFKTAHPLQVERVRQLVPIYQHFNQQIKCKVAIINWDVSIIDYIDKDAKIYQVIHGDYTNPVYTWKPKLHDRITQYIGVTKRIRDSFKDYMHVNNVDYSYNPLTIEPYKKRLTLVSATRLSRIKGADRMYNLATALDVAGINYVWYVFTNSFDCINKPNVVFMKNRLDVQKWIAEADYLVQLSDTEACSYAINEALYRNVPIIATKLPYLEEIGVKDGVNSYLMNFDCSNIDYIVQNIENVPKFKFKPLETKYDKLLYKSKSRYKGGKKVKVRALAVYEQQHISDNTLGRVPYAGEIFEVSEERYKVLSGNNDYHMKFVELVEEKPIETEKKEVAKETAVKKPTKTKKNAKK